MNYYPFHLGDYAAHTAHLEPMEDLAYRRMLDLYYRAEKALPVDVAEIARLTRLRDHSATIRDVLNEFFTLSDDGWHSKRADDELTAMKTKQEQQATKDQHEAERLSRYRARRAEMFTALRAVGVVPAWDVAMKELQRLFDAGCNEPETRTGALSEMDSQRLSLPTPTPTPKEEKKPPHPPQGGAEGFEAFWTAWPKHPRKVAQRQCRDKWRKGVCESITARIVAHVEASKASEAWLKSGGSFIPAPLVYLNQNRWEAEPAALVSMPITVASSEGEKTARYLAERQAHADEVERQRIARLAAKQGATA